MTTASKKLIEVSLPLDAINAASAIEKSIRHGHPSTLHLWWARRPLAACRAVLFASLVDDPSSHPEQFPTKEAQDAERERLHNLIERMVPWEATHDDSIIGEVQAEILKATGGNPPPVYDPFCGGGSIPLEAQRLGLEAHGSDLNPVPVLISKALIEIPPKFADQPPVNPESRKAKLGTWKGAQGLADDVRYYGEWMRREAERRIGHLYPKAELPKELGGGKATVVAWLWARTVKCPNPACGCLMPLVKTFDVSTKKGKEICVVPKVNRDTTPATITFEIEPRKGKKSKGTVDRTGAKCVACGESVKLNHIRAEGLAGRMSSQLMAMVIDGGRTRHYVPATEEHYNTAVSVIPSWSPAQAMPEKALGFRTQNYGMSNWRDIFTSRQLEALSTLSDLILEAKNEILSDFTKTNPIDSSDKINTMSAESIAYSDAVCIYLAFALSKMADRGSTICTWFTDRDSTRNTFSKQSIQMTWDYAELNVLLDGTGSYFGAVNWTAESIEGLPSKGIGNGFVRQADASNLKIDGKNYLFSTDPPYYDNISYADISDFFYIWLKKSLEKILPNLFDTILTPKKEELVATPYRFNGSRDAADKHFQNGLSRTFEFISKATVIPYPTTIFYAFKQSESDESGEDIDSSSDSPGNASTGWETMLEGLVTAKLVVTATWPMRTELSNRTVASGSNALASSIVLACRPRIENARAATRREFLSALRIELPEAMRLLQKSHIAPVDLAQAAIGPGMAVFSRYAKVLEADGSTMSVRTALQLINKALDEFLTEQEGDFDADSRWALTWFEQHGYEEGPYGVAETLSKARNTSVEGLEEAGILLAKAGKVRLLKREELPTDWNPEQDSRLTVWESVQHLIRVLEGEGEAAAGRLLLKLGPMGDIVRELAYRLYALCERKRWSQEAQAYNGLIVSWGSVQGQASVAPKPQVAKQGRLALED